MSEADSDKPAGNTWNRQIDGSGEFVRKDTTFRSWIREDGSTGFAPAAGRYHLYVSLACPWAHRTLIVRKLKGLEHAISVDVVDPLLADQGWTFEQSSPGASGDTVNGFERLRQVYEAADPGYDGVVTVPVLWDKHSNTIVNNESSEIIRLFNSEFQGVARQPGLDLYPGSLRTAIDACLSLIHI